MYINQTDLIQVAELFKDDDAKVDSSGMEISK